MRLIDKSIDMIWHTSTDGHITPIKFKIEGKNGTKLAYNILEIKGQKMTRIAGYKCLNYICDIQMEDQVRSCEIRYDLSTCKWILFRI